MGYERAKKMKKNVFVTLLSVVLALLMATIPSLQIAAAENENRLVVYLSEVRIGVGKTSEEAEKALEGYTILKDGNTNVDLNQNAGGGIGSKGERVVYLGYKTTTDRAEAITDLAVMNMKGGYSVKDYELLMEQYMTEQVIPFVEDFIATIKEYRENYNSSDEENKARAQYVHDALNKLTDDDCGDAGLGDLLLNETKYEMGDAAYEALSEEEKKKHADIVTIVCQANGQATLMIENLMTRAADTNEDTWVDRFTSTSYDDLLALYPDMLPSEAEAQLAMDYDNDAREILSMWSALKEQLDGYEEKVRAFDELSAKDLSAQYEIADNYDPYNATDAQTEAYAEAIAEIEVTNDTMASVYADISVKDYLSTIDFGEGTLADFFSQDYQTIKDDIIVLYPLVASLTEGQRAGLGFVTLGDLVMFTASNNEGYSNSDISDIKATSIYENVDRDVFKAGGVALTSEALRAHAAEEIVSQEGKLSALTYVLYGVTAASAVAFGYSIYAKVASVSRIARDIEAYTQKLEKLKSDLLLSKAKLARIQTFADDLTDGMALNLEPAIRNNATKFRQTFAELYSEKVSGTMEKLKARSPISSKFMIGFGVAFVVLSAISVYLTYSDLVKYYSVEYTPIPKYMVDEKDITAYNAKGEKIVIKNLAAYYKAVETNRAADDEWFEILGTSSDLNGTVGQQWLALYAAKNSSMNPIIASSLKAVVGNTDVPSDYSTGIHMFGSDAAYNVNSTQFVWNNDAPSVFVYFNVDGNTSGNGKLDDNVNGHTTPKSDFPAGYFILGIVIGLAVGALATVAVVAVINKKKTKEKQS